MVGDPPGNTETVRALLSAFANREGTPTPVSILSLRRELTRRRLSPDIKPQVDLLRRIGDIETIGSGFYLPVPTYAVLFGEWGLLISGLPNQEIVRLYQIEVAAPGSARIIRDLPCPATIGRRQASDWLGTPRSTLEWADAHLREARFGDPHGWNTLEAYIVDRRIGSVGWISTVDELLRLQGVHLLRNAIGTGPRSYYLLSVGAGGVDGMSELRLRGADIRRLQLALQAKAGASAMFSFRTCDLDTSELRAPFLPAEEKRFLEAIGRVQDRPDARGISATVPAYTRAAVTKCLQSLGLKEGSA